MQLAHRHAGQSTHLTTEPFTLLPTTQQEHWGKTCGCAAHHQRPLTTTGMDLPLSLYIAPTDGERAQDRWSCRRQWNLPPTTTNGMDLPLSLYRHRKWSRATPVLALQTLELNHQRQPMGWTYPFHCAGTESARVADSGTCHGPTPGVNLPLIAVQAHKGRGGMAYGCAEGGGTPGQRRSLGWTYPFSLHRHRRGTG